MVHLCDTDAPASSELAIQSCVDKPVNAPRTFFREAKHAELEAAGLVSRCKDGALLRGTL